MLCFIGLIGSTYYTTCKKHKNYEFCATELKQDNTYKSWDYCNQLNCPIKGDAFHVHHEFIVQMVVFLNLIL